MLGKRRADKLWLSGYQAWLDNNSALAQEEWEKALEADPKQADAALGLYSIDETRKEMLKVMLDNIERFGESREKHHCRLHAYYIPLAFMPESLELRDDVRRAQAVELIEQNEFKAAINLLDQCRQDMLTDSVVIRLLYRAQKFEKAIQLIQEIPLSDDSGPLADDINFFYALSLRQLSLVTPALEELSKLSQEATNSEVRLAALYQRAGLYKEQGEDILAKQDLERIYSLDVNYHDVSELLAKIR
jgi:tetratricopeptide (TPR) repeat protein